MFRLIVGIGALQVVVVLINMLRSKMVAVILGPQGVGIIGVVDQLVQIVLYVSTLSLPFAAVRFLSRAHSDGGDAFKNSYAAFLRVLLMLTTVGLTIGGLVAWFRPDLLGPELAQYRAFLLPALLGIPAMACHGLFSNVLAAGRRTRAAAIMTVVVAAALTTTSFVGLTIDGIPGLYWANLAANVLVAMGVAVYLWKRLDLPLLAGGHGIRRELTRNPDIVVFALTFYANAVFYSVSFFVARYSILSSFGEVEAGLLQAGIALFMSLNLVLGRATALYLVPLVNRIASHDEKVRATRQFERTHWLIALAVAMPVILFADWVVVLLFSPSFLAMSNVVAFFVIAQCLQLVSGNYDALLIGLDDLKMFGFLAVVGHVVVAGLAWLLAPSLGIAGVGLGFVVGSAVRYGIVMWRLKTRFGMRVDIRWGLTTGYGLAALGLAGFVSAHLEAGSAVVILGKGLAYALFCVSLLPLLGRNELTDLVIQGRRFLFPGGPGRASRTGGATYRRFTERLFPEAWAPTSTVAPQVDLAR